MNPDMVKKKWLQEYELIDSLLRSYNNSYVKVIQKQTSLSLVQTKRIVLAIQVGLSLEAFESANLPFLNEYIEELELQWNNNAS